VTDYLLVHGAGQGAWSWGRVWGYMTAPVEHPPRLYTHRSAYKVHPLDLPGHGADSRGDTGAVLMSECVQAIVRAVERQGLQNVVLVGHGFAGALVLQAAGQLPTPPKRLVLVAGIVPDEGKNLLSVFPQQTRGSFQFLSSLSSLFGQELKLPRQVISRYLCNGIDPMEIVQVIGMFGPLPTRVLKSRVSLDGLDIPCPVSYVLLTEDRILPAEIQRHMAERIPNVELIELESCHEVSLYRPRELADILLSFA
jgi:pimeloyl-ACP methyl ester carboxylesterase